MKRSIVIVACLALAIPGLGSALDQSRIGSMDQSLAPCFAADTESLIKAQRVRLEPLVTKEPKVARHRIGLAILEHNASIANTRKPAPGHARTAVTILEEVLKDQSLAPEERALATTYLGSAYSLRGNEEENPVQKINMVKKGLSILDDAVARYGNDYYLVRHVRSNVALSLPDFFESLGRAGEDLVYMEQRLKADPAYLPPGLQASVHLNLGTWYKKQRKLDKAMEAWKQALAADPQEKGPGRLAREQLELYGD